MAPDGGAAAAANTGAGETGDGTTTATGAGTAEPADGAAGGSGAAAADAGSKGLSEEWRTDLASGLDSGGQEKFLAFANRYESKNDFSKAVVNLRAEHDSRVKMPNGETKPEDLHDFHVKHFGKPSKPTEYVFNHLADAPVFNDVETEAQEGFREVANRLHLNQNQVDGLVVWNDEQRKMISDSRNKAPANFLETSRAALAKEWGPDIERNMNTARAGKNFGESIEGFTEFQDLRLEDGGLVGDHPVLARFYSKVGQLVDTDDVAQRELQGSSQAGDLRATLKEKQNELARKGISPSSREGHEILKPYYDKLNSTKPQSPLGRFGA